MSLFPLGYLPVGHFPVGFFPDAAPVLDVVVPDLSGTTISDDESYDLSGTTIDV